MSNCFVPLCTNNYRKSSVHLFCPSQSVALEWQRILKIRADKPFDPNNRTHRVCSDHFEEKYLVKEYKYQIDGQTVVLPMKKWSILPDAIPTLFPKVPVSMQPRLERPRRKLIRNQDPNAQNPKRRRIKNDKDEPSQQVTAPSVTDICDEIPYPDAALTKSDVEQWWKTKETNWIFDNCPSSKCSLHRILYNKKSPPILQKSILINFIDGSPVVEVFINGQTTAIPGIPESIKKSTDLDVLFSLVDQYNSCIGIAGYQKLAKCKRAIQINNNWFSVNCEKSGAFTVCHPCKLLHGQLQKASRKGTAFSINKGKRNSQKLLTYYKKQKALLAAKNKMHRQELAKLRKFLKTVDIERIETHFKQNNLSSQLKETLITCLKSSKVKSAKGMRYSTAWLLECLLLRIKSPAAYNHIREAKILPLPHPRTLRLLIAGQPCEFGFSETALQAIKREYRNKPQRDVQGVLVFDEMTVRESLDYNPHTFRLDGYVDYGNDNEDLVKDNSKMANHALVMMYRPLNGSWVQPISAFATRSAACGSVLHKIIMQAIIKLESVGAEVLSVVCDGAKTNKLFWKLCGVGEFNGEVINRIPHPCSDQRFLYFTCDVPHLIKCIRNHFRKYNVVQFFDKQIDFAAYETLFNEDSKRICGLRKCPNLTRSHIWPNCFEKMNVPYATQLFSRSVAVGLKFYREGGADNFEQYEDTECFTQIMNDIFDALNSTYPKQGMTINSSAYNCLKTFLGKLMGVNVKEVNNRSKFNFWFASSETLTALKITLKSSIEIIDYLITTLGFHYVLTAKLNQDCLERFFGLVRAAGGREEHPTVSNFLQLFRLLSLYSPVKRTIRGNIRSDEDLTVLVDLEASFRREARNVKLKRKNRKSHIDEIIMDKLLAAEKENFIYQCETGSDTDSCNMIFDKNLVYHLTGFLCHRIRKFIQCEDCISTLESGSAENCENVSKLTKMLDYGSLHYPNREFFEMVNSWERAICDTLELGKHNGDIIIDCINKVDPFQVSIGCTTPDHKQVLVQALLPYYVSMRVNFYSRSIRNSLGKRMATKNKRKESKLV